MKTMKHSGKKILSVFLAVLMVMTAWVFVAPEKATAAADVAPATTYATYHVKLTVKFENIGKSGHVIIYYYPVNADGTLNTSVRGEYILVNSAKQYTSDTWTFNTADDSTRRLSTDTDAETGPVQGWPCGVKLGSVSNWGSSTLKLTGLTIGNKSVVLNGGSWSAASGKTKEVLYNNTGSGWDGYLDWPVPAVSSASVSPTSTTINIPKSGTATSNVTAKFYDQYGVEWPDQTASASLSPAAAGSVTTSGSTATISSSINNLTSSNNYNSSTGKGTATLTMTKGNASASCNVTFQSPKYNAYLNYYSGANAKTYSNIGYYNQSVTLSDFPANSTPTQLTGNDQQHQTYTWPVNAKQAFNITNDTTFTEITDTPADHNFDENGNGSVDADDYTITDGNHSLTCADCGYTKTQAHKSGTGYVTKEETCTEDGIMTYDCSVCGKKAIETSVINKITGHDFSGEIVIKEEGENGSHWKKCVRFDECGAYGWAGVENKCEYHNWDKNDDGQVNAKDATSSKASTCKEAGFETYTCKVCSATWTKTLDLATHTIAATAAKNVTNVCGGEGNIAYWTCSVCDRVWTDAGLANEISNVDADNDGIPDAAETKGPDHEFTGAYVNVSNGADGTHYRQCKRFTQCGKYGLMVDGLAVEGAKEAHKFTSTETASSCTVQGTKTYTCSDCNHSYTEKLPLAAHTMETIAAVAATCTTGGNNKHYKCTACSQYFKDENGTTKTTVEDEKIAELKHTFIAGNDNADPTNDRLATAATCLAPAVYVTTCDRCGVESPDSRYSHGDPIAHVYNGTKKSNGDGTHSYACTNECNCGTYGVGSTKDATENCVYVIYSKIDTTEHKVSCACGDYKEEGHSYGSWIADTTGVGTEKGTMTRTCPLCGQTETTDCSYTEIGRVNATCDYPGSVTYKCTDENCGHTYTETLPALGHEWVENNETYLKSAATCEANAVYYKYCTKCQNSSQAYTCETWTKKGSKLTHDWNEWVQSVDENGVATHTRTCKHASSASCTETGTCSGGTANCVDKAVCAVCSGAYGEVDSANHKTREFVAKVDSTCQKTGTEAYYKCTACNTNIETPVVIAKKDHSYGAWTKIDGEDKHTRSCTTCDADVAAVAKETADCSGGEATCIARAKCEVCKAEYGEINSANHATQAATLKDAKEASCTEEGYTGDRHYNCCDAIKEKGTTIPMLDHKYTVALEDTKVASTCTEKGSIDYQCETCTAKEKRELELNPQNHSSEETIVVNDKAATCESDGYTGDTYHKCCYKPGGSTAENRYALISKGTVIKANGQHVYSAAVPEYMIKKIVEEKDAEGNVTSRSFDLKDEEPAYAEKIGYRRADNYWYHKQICTICYEVVETRCYTYPDHQADCVNTDSCFVCKGLCSLTNPDKHTLKEIEKISATCETDGRKAYYVCEDCGKEFFDLAGKNEITDENKSQLVIPSTMKHTIDRDDTPTQAKDDKGNVIPGKHAYSCSVCGTAIVEACSGGEATCKDKAKCEYCGVEYGELNKNKHVKGIIQGNVAPDRCKPGVSGKTVYECCPDVVVYEGDIIPATEPHDWKETTDKADNCANGYTITKTCNYCGEVETTEVAAGTHDLSVVVYETEKDCKKERTIYYACSICGFTDKEVEIDGVTYKYIFAEVIEAKEDCTWTSWTYEQKPSCVVEGKKTRQCVACGKTEEEILPKTDHTIKTEAGYAATCDKAGKQDYVYCVIEGCPYAKGGAPIGQLAGYEKYKDCNGKVIEALGHGDHNGDDYCDHCGGFLHENEDGTNCNCICHKRHWFMRIIYKILRFFWKLFGISRTCCSAGVHY